MQTGVEERRKHKPGMAGLTLPLMAYKKLDEHDAERHYFNEMEQSRLTKIKYCSMLFTGIITGKLRGL